MFSKCVPQLEQASEQLVQPVKDAPGVYVRAKASAFYNNAQSAELMASALVTLLSAFNCTGPETTETQEQISTIASAISDHCVVATSLYIV